MTASSPSAFHVMAKPTGARCNLHCDYCFFLEKEALYPGSDFRMSDETMRAYVEQTVAAQRVPHVTLAWQGGEPTLMGLDFFRRARAVEDGCVPPGMTVERTVQTNGVLLDDEWAEFLAANDYLVGLSIDGPRELHDAYRHDRGGRPVFDRVVAAARLLQRHGCRLQRALHHQRAPTRCTRSRSTASSATTSRRATSSSSRSSRSRPRPPTAAPAP